jgi:hypothetical protein
MSFKLLRNIYTDVSGNIGIGTITPQSSLDLGQGTIKVSTVDISGVLITKHPSGGMTVLDAFGLPLNASFNSLDVSNNIISNNITCNNLTVNGATTTIQSTVVTVEDPIIKLGGDVSNNKDKGIEFTYYDTSNKKGFIGYNNATGNFTMLKDATNTNEVFTGTKGNLEINALGIGTSIPTGSIDVRGNIVTGVAPGGYIGINAYYGGSPAAWRNIVPQLSAPSFMIRSENNPVSKIQFFCQTGSGTANSSLAVGERMCIKTDGNVGIGIGDPRNTLHVELNSATSNTQITCKNTNASGRAGIELSSGAVSSFNIHSANGLGILENNAGSINFYAKGSGSFVFHTTNFNTSRLFIANNGNVGIGKSPSTNLDVSGNVAVSGNVGIGITAPVRNLHGVGEFSWTPGAANDNVAYFNIHDTTGSNGGNNTVRWRGLGSNGTAQVNLASFDVYANQLFVNGYIKSNYVWFYAYEGGTTGAGIWTNYTGFVPFGSTQSGSTNFTTDFTSNGAYFTAPVKGIYSFSASVLNYPNTKSGISGIKFSVNGNTQATDSGYGYVRYNNIILQTSLYTSTSILLNANDTVKVHVYNIDLYTGTHHAHFSGYLVGAA